MSQCTLGTRIKLKNLKNFSRLQKEKQVFITGLKAYVILHVHNRSRYFSDKHIFSKTLSCY
jgi:hypothetical protein